MLLTGQSLVLLATLWFMAWMAAGYGIGAAVEICTPYVRAYVATCFDVLQVQRQTSQISFEISYVLATFETRGQR